jgi:hypothetical protein
MMPSLFDSGINSPDERKFPPELQELLKRAIQQQDASNATEHRSSLSLIADQRKPKSSATQDALKQIAEAVSTENYIKRRKADIELEEAKSKLRQEELRLQIELARLQANSVSND